MLAELRVGIRQFLKNSGVVAEGRGDQSGALVSTDGHGRYQEAVLQGNVWTAANSAVQALSLNSTATATGLILSNPAGSGKNLVLLEIIVAIAAAVTAVADVALCANLNPVAAATVHGTPLLVRNALLGLTGTGVGLADSAATLPAVPVIIRPLMGWHWVTAGTPTAGLFVKDEVAGALVVQPGCTVSVAAITAAHTALSSITWEEVPL